MKQKHEKKKNNKTSFQKDSFPRASLSRIAYLHINTFLIRQEAKKIANRTTLRYLSKPK